MKREGAECRLATPQQVGPPNRRIRGSSFEGRAPGPRMRAVLLGRRVSSPQARKASRGSPLLLCYLPPREVAHLTRAVYSTGEVRRGWILEAQSDARVSLRTCKRMATDGKQSTARRDLLQQIEADVQKKWEKQKIFECDAPDSTSEKFMCTFPYPYMSLGCIAELYGEFAFSSGLNAGLRRNGLLHIGHAFSLTTHGRKHCHARTFQVSRAFVSQGRQFLPRTSIACLERRCIKRDDG